jgi:hypothetical protein
MINFIKSKASLIDTIISVILVSSTIYIGITGNIGDDGAAAIMLGVFSGIVIMWSMARYILNDFHKALIDSLDKREELIADNRRLLDENEELLTSNPFLGERGDNMARMIAEQTKHSEYVN